MTVTAIVKCVSEKCCIPIRNTRRHRVRGPRRAVRHVHCGTGVLCPALLMCGSVMNHSVMTMIGAKRVHVYHPNERPKRRVRVHWITTRTTSSCLNYTAHGHLSASNDVVTDVMMQIQSDSS